MYVRSRERADEPRDAFDEPAHPPGWGEPVAVGEDRLVPAR